MAAFSSWMPGNFLWLFNEPNRARGLGSGRTTALPSSAKSHCRRCRGFMPRASRTSLGTVVWPLSVTVDSIMVFPYFKYIPIVAQNPLLFKLCITCPKGGTIEPHSGPGFHTLHAPFSELRQARC